VGARLAVVPVFCSVSGCALFSGKHVLAGEIWLCDEDEVELIRDSNLIFKI